MAKELHLYSGLGNWSVEMLMKEINDNMAEDVVLRVNSPGGDVFASFGLYSKLKEHGDVTIKVDGMAASAAANLLLYAKRVECLNVSTFMFHRAASYNEENEEAKALVVKVNKDLRKQLESKVDADTFKKVTGYSVDDMFNMETRVNVWLTAKQMKDLGIVTKVRTLSPEEEKAMAEATANFAYNIAATLDHKNSNSQNSNDMTVEKLKAEHPAIYSALIEAGKKQEQERVKAWMAFQKVDADAVAKGISEGAEVTASVIAEMSMKAINAKGLKEAETESPGTTETGGAADVKAKTEQQKELVAFEEGIYADLGLKKK